MRLTIPRKDDRWLIKYLAHETFPDDTPVNVSRGTWWVIWDQQYPIGFVGLERRSRRRGEPHATFVISRVGILPHARGNGRQRQIVDIMCREARNRGGTRVVAQIHCSNIPSLRNFAACGFKPYHAVDGFTWWEFPIETLAVKAA